MWLRALVGVLAGDLFTGLGVDIPVPLRGSVDAVCEVKARVEPLRAVGRGNLLGEHVDELIIEGFDVLGGVEVAEFLAPGAPASGQTVEDLAGVGVARL